MRVKTGDRAVQKRKRLMKRAQDRVTIMDKRRASMPQKKSKGGKIMISDVRNMKMTQRQKQLVGAGGASKLASMINKLPKSGKLALAGGLTAGTIALISKLNPGASRAGKQLREMKKKKIQEMKKKK